MVSSMGEKLYPSFEYLQFRKYLGNNMFAVLILLTRALVEFHM